MLGCRPHCDRTGLVGRQQKDEREPKCFSPEHDFPPFPLVEASIWPKAGWITIRGQADHRRLVQETGFPESLWVFQCSTPAVHP